MYCSILGKYKKGNSVFVIVAKIFLENQQGERILCPTTKPGIAQIYARHLAEGGLPHDDRWSHIGSLVEEYSKMAGFVRATRNNQFNESTQQLVQEGINHYNSLRETLGKMRGHRGYQAYFESYTPNLMETEGDDSINELFVQETLDPRIESVMPILAKLHKRVNEMSEVKELAEWADGLTEDESLTSNNPVGIPESGEIEETVESELLGIPMMSANIGGKKLIWYRKKGDNYIIYGTSPIVSNIDPAKAKTTFDQIANKLKTRISSANVQGVAEDLGPEQKAAGQLGPTEKIGKKGAVGKLVGANESFINTSVQSVTTEDDVMEGLDPEKRQRLDDLIDAYRDSTDPNDYYDRDYEDPDDVIAMIRSEFGDKIADQVEAGADKMHFPRQGHSKEYDPLGWKKPVDRITKAGKMYKQDSDYLKNTIKARYKNSGKSATEGVAEGKDPDTQRLEQEVRDALANGDDYTAKQYAKMAPTPEAKKYLQKIIRQEMYGTGPGQGGVAEGMVDDWTSLKNKSGKTIHIKGNTNSPTRHTFDVHLDKNNPPIEKGRLNKRNIKLRHDTGEFDKHFDQGVAEGFDSAAFDRHMDKLRAQKELEKTDPLRALVNKMHSDDAHAEKLKRKPKPDDERQITDPFHSSQGVNIGEQGVAEGADYTPPELGTVKANLMNTQKPTVQVQVFKHNTLRGDSYWVTREVKTFKTMDQAQAYVDRINNQGVAEGSENILPRGTVVTVLHKGKQVPGKIVRYDAGKGGYSNAYVVYIGEYESIFVPANKIQQGVAEGYNTGEDNREQFDNIQDWAQAVKDAGGDVIKGRTGYIAHGWDGEIGEWDKSANQGWLVAKFSEGVAEGKFTINAKTGAKLHPKTGAELPSKEKPLTMKQMFAPKAKAPSAPKLTLSDVWRKVEEVVSQIYPDGDPIDWLVPWFKKQGISSHNVGGILERAAKKNGYKDIYDYWDSFGADVGYSEKISESQDDLSAMLRIINLKTGK